MKRFFRLALVFVALFFSLVTVGSQRSFAADRLPAQNCSGCGAISYWSGFDDHGMGTSTIVDNPGGSNFVSYDKTIEIGVDSNNYVLAGMDHSGFCSSSSLQWFYIYVISGVQTYKCLADVSSNDYNNTVTMKISYFVSNGGGAFVTFNDGANQPGGESVAPCTNSCAIGSSEFTNYYTYSYEGAALMDSSFSNHEVWGGQWQDNNYFVGSWAFDKTDPSVTAGNPMQESSWRTLPSASGTGGTWYTCAYPSPATACTLGS